MASTEKHKQRMLLGRTDPAEVLKSKKKEDTPMSPVVKEDKTSARLDYDDFNSIFCKGIFRHSIVSKA